MMGNAETVQNVILNRKDNLSCSICAEKSL